MPRVKRGVVLRKRRKRVLKQAKGYRSGRGNLNRQAQEAVDRALNFAYRDRRRKKRDFRRLWISRINAAVRSHDLNYSQFMNGLKRANIAIDRKNLSEIAIHDPSAFSEIVGAAKGNI